MFGKTRSCRDVSQPAVDDAETEQLVDQKVDAFWKGIEGGMSKRGQVCSPAQCTTVFNLTCAPDCCDIFGEAGKEVVVPRRRGTTPLPIPIGCLLNLYLRKKSLGKNG